MKRTQRGFRIYAKFKDSYGSDVRIQESSNAEGCYCWIFSHRANDQETDFPPHLSITQAKRVVAALTKFIEEGGKP